MQRQIIRLSALLLAMASTAAHSSTMWRVGVGYSETDFEVSSQDKDLGSGVKVEFGYDMSPFVGVKVSYEQNEADINLNNSQVEFDGSTLKGALDLGYPIKSAAGVLKPYMAVGLTSYSADTTQDIAGRSKEDSVSSSKFHYGIGARYTTATNLYVDLSYDLFEVEDKVVSYDTSQAALTIGYNF